MALIFTLEAGKVWAESGDVIFTLSDLNKAFSEASVSSISGTLEAGNYGQESIVQNDIAQDILDGSRVKQVANSSTTGGIVLLHRVTTTTNSTANYDIVLDDKTRIVQAWLVVEGNPTAGDKVRLVNGTGSNYITEDMSLIGNVSNKTAILVMDIPTGDGDTDIVLDDGFEVTDFHVVLESNGSASDKLTLANSSGTAVTDQLDVSGSDKAIVRATTIDTAVSSFATGATIRVTATGGFAGTAKAYVTGVIAEANEVQHFNQIDSAHHDIEAAGTLRVAVTNGTTVPPMDVYIFGVKVP